MNKNEKTCIAYLAVAIGAATLTSCAATSGSQGEPHRVPAECTAPIRVAGIFDQSTSMSMSGTAAISPDQLKPLLDTVETCGGTVGVAFVREVPQPGIERIDFEMPPPLPTRPVEREGEENYEFDDRVAAYDQAVLDRAGEVDRRAKDKVGEIDAFLGRIARRLDRPPAKETDLNSGLDAAEIFLSEPGIPQNCRKYLVVDSDGLDNGGRPLVAVKSDAKVLWINSTSPEKVLSRYRAARLESFAAAVNFIVRDIKKEDLTDANAK